MPTDREIERVIWLALPLNVDQFDVAKRILRKLDAHGLEVVRKDDPRLDLAEPCTVPGCGGWA